MNNPFEKVGLLTLSAFDTAIGSGNRKEVEGLAHVAQSLGTKSVIASLWPVSHTGTDELMVRFNKIRAANRQLTKSEAFNRGQLSLLSGEYLKLASYQDESASRRTRTEGNRSRTVR